MFQVLSFRVTFRLLKRLKRKETASVSNRKRVRRQGPEIRIWTFRPAVLEQLLSAQGIEELARHHIHRYRARKLPASAMVMLMATAQVWPDVISLSEALQRRTRRPCALLDASRHQISTCCVTRRATTRGRRVRLSVPATSCSRFAAGDVARLEVHVR